MKYSVIVGNVGTVHETNNRRTAVIEFNRAVTRSKTGAGRDAGEPVTLMADDEPVRDYEPQLSFDEALDAIGDGRQVENVHPKALQRKIWVAEWHIPGCLSESFSILTTKKDAIACALEFCGNVRGARADLTRYGRTDRVSPDAYVSMAITTVEKRTLGDLL